MCLQLNNTSQKIRYKIIIIELLKISEIMKDSNKDKLTIMINKSIKTNQ